MIPERIGRYRVLRTVASGGFATVYAAVDERLDSVVAVKVLSDAHSRDPEIVRRFIDEARLMRQLRVPGLVTVYDSGEHEGRPYFVMEYCERGTLAGRLADLGRPLTTAEGFGLVQAMAAAVAGAHRARPPVVHRDLKPSNFLIRHTPNETRFALGDVLEDDESLVLGDFGLAKVVTPDATQLSLIAYTRGFAAPEQVRGDAGVTPSVDVYSASAVTVSALTGASPAQVFVPDQRAFDESVLRLTEPLRPELERGLAYDPQHRHPDIMTWAAALERCRRIPPYPSPSPVNPAASSSAVPPGAVLGASPPGTPLTRRHLITGLTVIVLAGGGGGTALWRRRSGGPAIVGPGQAQVGDEVAFAAAVDARVEWRSGQHTTTGRVLTLLPTDPGTVAVEARTSDGTRRLPLTVRARDESGLRIVGPAHLPLDELVSLHVDGAVGASITWQVGDRTSSGPSLQLRPTKAGLIGVRVSTGDGRATERTFTAAPR